MAEQSIELAPSESKSVSFEAIPHEAKTYNVSVDGLNGSFKAIKPLPSLTITGFHYVYKVYTWTLGTRMIHGGGVVAVGFAFKNNEPESVPGISLRCTTIGGGITRNLSPPRNQYWVVISQPMTIAPGYTQVWYAWNTGYHNNPSSASIIAEVLVDGVVVATRSQDFTISYT